MVSSLAMQAQGSAFFHASRTYVGAVLDVKMTDIFAYVVHQAVISSLGEINNTLIRDLSKQNRYSLLFEYVPAYLIAFLLLAGPCQQLM